MVSNLQFNLKIILNISQKQTNNFSSSSWDTLYIKKCTENYNAFETTKYNMQILVKKLKTKIVGIDYLYAINFKCDDFIDDIDDSYL